MTVNKLYEGKAQRGAASTLRALKTIPRELIESKTILDLGCNEGLVAEFLVETLGAGRVVGYEPHPVAYQRATARAAGRFEVREAAVTHYAGMCTIATSGQDAQAGYYCNTAVKHGTERVTDEQHTVICHAYADVLNDVKPDGIKMDIEGSEYELMLYEPVPDSVNWMCIEFHALKSWGMPLLPFIHGRMTSAGFGITRWPSDLKFRRGEPAPFQPFGEINYVRGAQTLEERAEFLRAVVDWYKPLHIVRTPRNRDPVRRAMLHYCYGDRDGD